MKLKHIARMTLAALAVTAMGQAMAVTSTSLSNSTLELLIGDQNHSYLFDTGVSIASLQNSTGSFSAVLPNWASFNFAATTPFDSVSGNGVRWALQSGTYVSGAIGTSNELVSGSLTAMTDGSLPVDSINNLIVTQAAQAQKFNDSANVGPLLASGQNIAVNNDASGAFVTDPQFNEGYSFQQNGQALLAGTNKLGLFLESQVGTPRTANGFTTALVTPMNEIATFDTSTGRLTIAAAPVPEPESYALMLAGLVAVVFISRRRQHNA